MSKFEFIPSLTILVMLLLIAVVLTGCATPETVLKNEKTGQVAVCGGSRVGAVAGGLIGYNLTKADAKRCVTTHQQQGFTKQSETD